MANKRHLAIIKKGVGAWNKWLQKMLTDEMFDRMRADLKGQDFSEENLKGIRFLLLLYQPQREGQALLRATAQ